MPTSCHNGLDHHETLDIDVCLMLCVMLCDIMYDVTCDV